MLATVFAAKMCDYGMVCMRVLRKKPSADLDRLETMCACLFSLFPEDNERTTILKNGKNKQKIVVRCQNGLPHQWHIQRGVQPFVPLQYEGRRDHSWG